MKRGALGCGQSVEAGQSAFERQDKASQPLKANRFGLLRRWACKACEAFTMDIVPRIELCSGDSSEQDVVFIRGLSTSVKVGRDAWHRIGRLQPALIDVRMGANLRQAGAEDILHGGVDYGKVSKGILAAVTPDVAFEDLFDVLDAVRQACWDSCGQRQLETTLFLPQAVLLADGVGVRNGARSCFFVQHLRSACIIGLNPHERTAKQEVLVDLNFEPARGFWSNSYQALLRNVAEVRMILLLIRNILDLMPCAAARIDLGVQDPRGPGRKHRAYRLRFP